MSDDSHRARSLTLPDLLSCIRSFATRWLVAAALLYAPLAFGQLGVDWPSGPLEVGQRANAFLRWDGLEPLGGLRFEAPPGWTVERVSAVRAGSTLPVPLAVTERGGAYEASARDALRGAQTLIVGLTVGPSLGYQTLRTVPVTEGASRPGWGADWSALVREATPAGPGRAFHLGEGERPVLLRRRVLPSFAARDPFTLEAWLKTVGLSEVVLSTWDGDEDRPYPLELVVDGLGRLVFYAGQPGRHESMHSTAPVADGRWHHAAVVSDPREGWMRLFVDGLAVDSLRSADAAGTLNTMSLALGGRAVRPGTTPQRTFSGYLDELRVWNVARSGSALRRAMRLPLSALPEGSLGLSFDRPLPPEALVETPPEQVRVPSDLSFAFPVEALEASVQAGIVTLTWQTKDRRAEAFRVERSEDGQRFETVGTVGASARVGETAGGAARFAYTDLPPDGQVLYYRVRQLAPDGSERVSGTFKLGLGADEAAAAVLVGTSPNPFQGRTTITYELARPERVRLSVWDVAGTRVATLVDEALPAGRHTYRFAADGLPSGVYFVRLETPSGSAAHKLTLTR